MGGITLRLMYDGDFLKNYFVVDVPFHLYVRSFVECKSRVSYIARRVNYSYYETSRCIADCGRVCFEVCCLSVVITDKRARFDNPHFDVTGHSPHFGPTPSWKPQLSFLGARASRSSCLQFWQLSSGLFNNNGFLVLQARAVGGRRGVSASIS